MLERVLSAPITVSLHFTSACNLRCRHCYVAAGRPADDELTTEEWLLVIRELAEQRVFNIFVNGGEPLVRPDIMVLLDELARHPFVVRLFTNGTLVTDTVADQLLERGLGRITVSLDGPTAEIHDWIRGTGAFERAISGIRRLVQRGAEVNLSVTAMASNHAHMPDIVRLARDLGVESVVVNGLFVTGRAAQSNGALGLSPAQTQVLLDDLVRLREVEGRFLASPYLQRLDLLASGVPVGAGSRTLASCGAAKTSCSIRPDGWVTACNYLWDVKCGNVRHEPFARIWQESDGMQQFRALSHHLVEEIEACQTCGFKTVCDGGCRARAYGVGGDFFAGDPFCWCHDGDLYARDAG
ncbi:MAG: radical SAM protein, partial [Anaerolineae bacterium]